LAFSYAGRDPFLSTYRLRFGSRLTPSIEEQHGEGRSYAGYVYGFPLSATWRSDFISRFGVSVGSEVWGLVGVI
jgi:hypothetical protein